MIIERVFACPKKPPYNSLNHYLHHEEDGEDRKGLRMNATGTDTSKTRSRRKSSAESAVSRERSLISSGKHYLGLGAEPKKAIQQRKLPR